jgi:hypothetical protein
MKNHGNKTSANLPRPWQSWRFPRPTNFYELKVISAIADSVVIKRSVYITKNEGFGSFATFWLSTGHFRSFPVSGHAKRLPGCLKGAKSGSCTTAVRRKDTLIVIAG